MMKLTYNCPVFPDQTMPYGLLIDDVRCQACWYMYCLLQKAKEQYGDGIDSQRILEGNAWKSRPYLSIKRTVGIIYGLDVGEIEKFWPLVADEASRLKLPAPSQDYMSVNPFNRGIADC